MSGAKKTEYQKMTMLGQDILPGKALQLNLEVAHLHTRTPIQVPVLVERAKEDGPTILVMAGLHGDELNGIEIVRRFLRKKLNKPTKGTIICLPIFNIFGFLNLQRELPDGRDLNRSFPGSSNGSLASQFAFHFMKEIAPHCDYIIDFHTGATQRNNFPQIRCECTDQQSVALAKIFNPPFILHSNLIAKTLRESIVKRNKMMLLFEGGKSNNIEENVVEEGLNGLKRVISHLGMRNYKIDISKDRLPIFIGQSKWMRAPSSGMFQCFVANGTAVQKGEILALVTDPYGKYEKKIKASQTGYVICINEASVVYKGDAIIHLAKENPQLFAI